MTLDNIPQRDTASKASDPKWRNEDARTYSRTAFSAIKQYPDSSLSTFHRRIFQPSWQGDLGNQGSPSSSLFFEPSSRQPGLSLGYHVFDSYRFDADSLQYYNTNRPYSSFTYQLGSKLEQLARILHTQNVRPNWNIAARFQKITSPGFFSVQRTNHDNASLSTWYVSPRQHYELFAGFVYNKEQQDENGGIVSDTFLSNDRFSDRQTIDTRFENSSYSTRRSPVVNNMRDFSIVLRHGYTLGRTDTLYNADSTQYSFKLLPRFRIAHSMTIGSEKHTFKDLRPDSVDYAVLFSRTFGSRDSVYSVQDHFYVDNTLMLEGFLGPEGRQARFSAGAGNRFDRFGTDYVVGEDRLSAVSNYLVGSLQKEALEQGQWSYNADARFFVTGDAAGDLLLQASVGKELRNDRGFFRAGFRQLLSEAPYNYTLYRNQYYTRLSDFGKESQTLVYGELHFPRWRLSAGVRNQVIGNYLYVNDKSEFVQASEAFNVTQAWLRKTFRYRALIFDNEIAFQQTTGDAPLNLPKLMTRHQLGVELLVFKKALKIATGLEARYHTPYYGDGYNPLFNRFYYQNSYEISNIPEASFYFNFKVKKFRAYLMLDQLQQIIDTKNIIRAPGYPAQNFMIRFGFNWIMIN